MGPKKSKPIITHTIQHHYHENPKTIEKLKKLQNDYLILQKQISYHNNPENAEVLIRQVFLNFLNSLQPRSIYQKLPKKSDLTYIGVMGIISSGKSSLINYAFGINEKVGCGEVTSQIKIVYKDAKTGIAVWDSPGLTELSNIQNVQVLKAFYQIDRMFILYRQSPKMIYKSIMVMSKINPKNTFLVRSQCDNFGSRSELKETLNKDEALLKQWGVDLPIYAISTRMDLSYMGNQKIMQLMHSK